MGQYKYKSVNDEGKIVRGRMYATNELDATVNGAGTIYYYGNPPTVKTSISGVGQIVPR